MKFPNIFLLTVLFLFLKETAYADIQKVFCFDEAIQKFQETDTNTLVLFDVDDVLVMPENDYRFQNPSRKKQLKTKVYSFYR